MTRQIIMVALLFAGYASYYFCRSDFSVALPMLVDELHRSGLSTNIATVRLGAIASVGVLAYATGKFLLGGLGDFWGGRRNFIAGLGGAVVFTILFGLGGGLPIFTLAWIGNRLVQSMGWAGLVKICSKWFSYTSYGTIVGVLSLSFLIGDAIARQSMGMLIQAGFGWRALFYFAAAVAGVVLLGNLLLLRESRTTFGYAEPEVNPLNVFESRTGGAACGLRAFLRRFVTNRAFWIVCFLSLGTTIIREAFNTWTPTYLHQLFGFSEAKAAGMSAIFPAIGAVSVIVAGWAGDRLGVNGRSIVMFFGLVTTAVGLLALASIAGQGASPLITIGVVAFGLLGPYSYLAGAMALDFGGSQGGATSSGIIDGVGYLGGVLAGDSVARLSVAFGWRGVFVALAVVSAVSAFAACLLFLHQRSEIAKRKGMAGA
ncbi:MAG TPA: MFS transporter [Bryobacteraceae bacterium]|nr:MFS transporter [Bryobacteraceae bacterium]